MEIVRKLWRGRVPYFKCSECPYNHPSAEDVGAHQTKVHACARSPRVSCLLLTKNRREFLRRAVRYFIDQTYPNKELIVVADSFSDIEGCVPVSSSISVLYHPGCIGEKRNAGCHIARGKYIAVWDDDDWQHPDRIATQVRLLEAGAHITGNPRARFHDLTSGRQLRYANPATLLVGSTIMFRKEDWLEHPYPEIQVQEDSQFISKFSAAGIARDSTDLTIPFIHSHNTSQKRIASTAYTPLDDIVPVVCRSKSVTISYLVFDTWNVSFEGLRWVFEEARRWNQLAEDTCGASARVHVTDNGSTYYPQAAIEGLIREYGDVPCILTRNATNLGNSVARNHVIDVALADGWYSDYIAFIDGDIYPVPFSIYTMAHLMDAHPTWGVLGMFSGCWTNDVKLATPECIYVPPEKIWKPDHRGIVAWTQYGLFRKELWQAGVRFDTTPPFDGPGWGFEDNDLGMQIDEACFDNRFINYHVIYPHLHYHSSWDSLAKQGVDVLATYKARQQYVVQKWKHTKAYAREVSSLASLRLDKELERRQSL